MIKMTQKQVDKLFVGMAHDLRSKLIESVEIIYNNLFANKKRGAVDDTEYLMAQIRSRLLIEFGWLVSDDQLRSIEDGKKKRTKKKSSRKTSKKTIEEMV
jgi:hypothetical protein